MPSAPPTAGTAALADRALADRALADRPLATTVDIETPELIVVSYTVAGVGSRMLAGLIDAAITLAAFIGTIVLFLTMGDRILGQRVSSALSAYGFAMVLLLQFALVWGYYVLFEALADGQTPGKRAMHLRVVRDGGYSITFSASAVRNLMRVIDMQPFVAYFVGMLAVITTKRSQRLGDLVAGTLVVREGSSVAPTVTRRTDVTTKRTALSTALTSDEFDVLDRFVQRRMELSAAQRSALAGKLVARFATVLATTEPTTSVSSDAGTGGAAPTSSPRDGAVVRLVRLHDREAAARAQGVAARNDKGAARERFAIVATNAPRWAKFSNTLALAQSRGLASLGEERVRDFVAEYRVLAADLARLRTASAGRPSDDVFYLNRLVAGAHNLLYRRRGMALSQIARYLLVTVPGEIRASWRAIALATLLLFAPLAITARAVITHPKLAEQLLPYGMMQRATEGVERAKKGTGYIPDPKLYRPVMASEIVTNNVQVTFFAFAGGIAAGVFTLMLLVSNGISIGAVLGLYQTKHILPLLLAFVAPHSVFELSAICIAGGGGLLIAAGMLIPGNRTRRRALVENGRRAITLIAGSGLLLVVAGSLEGFVSPRVDVSLTVKTAIAVVSAVLLALYVRAPWRLDGTDIDAPSDALSDAPSDTQRIA